MRFFIALLFLVTLSPSAALGQSHKPAGTYQKNLGKRVSLGTVGQCKQILQMMKEKPGRGVYTISYTDIVGARSFSVNMKAGTITRNQIGGNFGYRRRTETWTGNVMKRLKDGASDNVSSLGDDYKEEKL